jgi:hypothetical protein
MGARGGELYVELWILAPWQMRVPQIGMAVALMLLGFTVGRPNPFSFGGARNQDFDPDLRGILRLTRYPILAALAIWVGAYAGPARMSYRMAIWRMCSCSAASRSSH